MSNIVVVMRGHESIKSINQFKHSTIPFLGVEHKKESPQLVVGLLFPYEDKKPLYAETSRMVIAWRAFHFLHALPNLGRFYDDDLSRSVSFMRALQAETGSEEITEAWRKKFCLSADESRDVLKAARQVQDQGPSKDEIDAIVFSMRQNSKKCFLNVSEIRSELLRGTIEYTSSFDEIFKQEERETEEYERQRAIRDRVLLGSISPESDVGLLFDDLGIGFFEFLEQRQGAGYRTVNSPARELTLEVLGEVYGPHSPKYSLHEYGGEMGRHCPEFKKGNKRYLFLSISLEQNRLLIETRVETYHEDETGRMIVHPVHGKYTIPELREKIGIPLQQ